MVKIRKVGHLGMPVNDLQRAVKFDTEVLGMKCMKIDKDVETGGLYKEAIGEYPSFARLFLEDGTELVLFERPNKMARGDFEDGTSHLALETTQDEFNRASEDLRKAGARVVYENVVRNQTIKSLYFFDPEGNYIQLRTMP